MLMASIALEEGPKNKSPEKKTCITQGKGHALRVDEGLHRPPYLERDRPTPPTWKKKRGRNLASASRQIPAECTRAEDLWRLYWAQ